MKTRMLALRLLPAIVAALAPVASAEESGAPPPNPPPASSTTSPAPTEPPEGESLLDKWTFDASAFTVNPPHDNAYTSATFKADREALHLEGRWNYEDLHTGSIWAGWNIDWPAKEEGGFGFTVTPMVGLVSGDTDGWAPGAEVDIHWWWLELYNESEYLIEAHDRDNDFFYSWTEFTLAPKLFDDVDLRVGVVGQRTQAYDTELSVDRGLLFGATFKRISGTLYWFNPDKDDSYFMLTVGFSF